MKYEIVPSSCRICLRKCKKLRSFFTAQDDDETPAEMLKQLTGIVLEEDVEKEGYNKPQIELPKRICKSCELSLNMAFQFRIKALKSQRLVEIYCDHKLNKSDDSFHNNPEIKEELEDDCLEPLEEEFVQVQELSVDKRMKVEELKVQSIEPETILEEGVEIAEYLDESYLDLEDYDNYTRDESVLHNNSDVDPCDKTESLDEASNDIMEDLPREALENKTNKKLAARRGRKSKIKSNEPPLKSKMKPVTDEKGGHICDVCGNIFSMRGRMMEHRRRHDKELRFACELCDKRFHLRENLRKHMYSHSGGKPYKCTFCSRTFFYESVRKAHEAIHQGHKPYVCNIQNCKKAFAYSQTLAKHKLIHANIKLYHCEYCKKDFRLQHHLKQHIETKMHQNAIHLAELNDLTANGIL